MDSVKYQLENFLVLVQERDEDVKLMMKAVLRFELLEVVLSKKVEVFNHVIYECVMLQDARQF